MDIRCPEHGAMLCYGQFGDFRLYRCELGFARIKRHLNSQTTEYVQVTHREYWVYDDGTIKEVTPHTLMGKKIEREGGDSNPSG